MSDNILQTLQQLVQDVIAPDVRELKVRLSSLEKQIEVRFDAMDHRLGSMDHRFDSMDHRFDSMDQKNEARFKALLAAIAEMKAQTELNTFRAMAALSERIAVLESQRH